MVYKVQQIFSFVFQISFSVFHTSSDDKYSQESNESAHL